MISFEQRVLAFMRQNALVFPRGLMLVGVSGGADSMALLSVLAALRHDLGMRLSVAHFNHRYRKDALDDQRFVARWCHTLQVPLIVGQRQGAVVEHLSEDHARQMRFDFFRQTAQAIKAQAVALAHTQNDLAETVLMRLMRGCGLYGLRAILPKRSLDAVMFVRPLLGVCRQEVEGYLSLKKIPFCQDSTNRSLRYQRNKVRRELLPLLAKDYNPQIVDALCAVALTATEDYAYLSLQAQRLSDKVLKVSQDRVRIDLKVFCRSHASLRRLVLRKALESLTQDTSLLSFEHSQTLERIVSDEAMVSVDLPQGLKALRKGDFLEIYFYRKEIDISKIRSKMKV